MARFELHIKCDNAAFDEDPEHEIARILRELAGKMPQEDFRHDNGEGTLRDINGNSVGKWEYRGDGEEEATGAG